MSIHTFMRTAKWWNEWAVQSVKLVKDSFPKNPSDIDSDESRIRSFYILLSYAFELMLKSRLVAVIKGIDENQLITEYKHDIEKILRTLKSLSELEKIGIDSFQKNKSEHFYIIKTTQSKEFVIHDFTNIRYYPKPHKTHWDEPRVIKDTTEIILGIAEKIAKLWRGI